MATISLDFSATLTRPRTRRWRAAKADTIWIATFAALLVGRTAQRLAVEGDHICRKTGTILFVSHDTGAVVNLCQRAMWLQDGVVRALGPPKEIAEADLTNFYVAQQGPRAVRDSAPKTLSGASATGRSSATNGWPT